jgi:hypothetical protein
MAGESDYTDPILDELHAIRQQMLAECGGSLEKLVEKLQQAEATAQQRTPAVPITLTPAVDSAGVDK